jgi:hypothetical protein
MYCLLVQIYNKYMCSQPLPIKKLGKSSSLYMLCVQSVFAVLLALMRLPQAHAEDATVAAPGPGY